MKNFSKNLNRTLSLVLSLLMLLNLSALASSTANLAAKMYWTADMETGVWADAQSAESTAVFGCENFQPGDESIRYIKIENIGKRALSYALAFTSESEIGELANVIDVYKAENVFGNTSVANMTLVGTLADVINGSAISAEDILPGALADDGFYSGNTVVAIALKMKDDTSMDYANKTVDSFSIKLTAWECAYDNYPSVDKFELKFPNTTNYIYRVGNANAVKLGSLFGAIEGAEIGNVSVQIEKLDSVTDVSGAYTAASDWKNSTIQFTGTGPVKVTIDDDDFANALSVNLEVINAKNLTSAESVTSKDAVLLNDVNFSTLTVSGGHTLYGNGFELRCPNDSKYSAIGYAFLDLNNGTIDNVKVICPNFSYPILYQSNMKDTGNGGEQSSGLYPNVRSGINMSGNSKIVNSFVSGGRAAIYAPSGYATIENSTIYGGAAANIHLGNAKNLTLRDATLIQEPIKANVNDTSKTVMGMSVFIEADGEGNSAPITLEGDFIQYAWAHEGYKDYVPSVGNLGINPVSTALSVPKYQHAITYKDGTVGNPSINLSFICFPSELVRPGIPNVTDNRINKDAVPYEGQVISYASVYSYVNTNGLDDSFATIPVYSTECSANIPSTLKFTENMSGVGFETAYDADKGNSATLTVDLDTVGTYNFSFDKLVAEKFGRNLSYTVKDSSGNTVDKSAVIALSDSTLSEYELEITDDIYYGADGQVVAGKSETYSYAFTINATKTSIAPPEKTLGTWEDPLLVVKGYDSDWSAAFPASLSSINIKYYSTAAKDYTTINLGSIIPSSVGKQNGTENFWEYKGSDFTFKVSCGYIHEGKKVYGMPVVVPYSGSNRLYFTISSTNGYVQTGTSSRAATLTYEFTDNNGSTISFTKSTTATRASIIDGSQGSDTNQYSYSDFISGKLTATSGSSGGGCFAEGTLITLADGTQKPIESLTFEDEILVWDFFNGEYTTSVPSLLLDDGEMDYDVITLNFSDGTSVRTIYEHGFFDVQENDFVLINADNVNDFVGHTFVKNNGKTNETVTLESYAITNENIGCYTILTAFHNNAVANGMLTVTPPPIDNWYNYFEIGEGMKYDAEAMNEDIEEYGLYTYDVLSDYITYEEFLAFNGPYLKILVGKGYFTFDAILEQIAAFGVGNSIAALVSDEEITISIDGNRISSADYAIDITVEGATGSDGVYTVTEEACTVTLTARGTAATGYAKLSLDGDTYYTAQLAPGESSSIAINNIRNAKDNKLTLTYSWGNSGASDTLEKDAVIDFGEFKIKSIDGASVTLSNTTSSPVTCDIYIAVFSGNKCIYIEKCPNTTIEKEFTFTAQYTLPEGATVKAFVWETNTLNPIL